MRRATAPDTYWACRCQGLESEKKGPIQGFPSKVA